MSNVIHMLVSRSERRFIGPNGSIYVDRDQAHDDLSLELADAMTQGLAGKTEWVPNVTQSHCGSGRETLQDVPMAVAELLDYAECMESLMALLVASSRPGADLRAHADKLRAELIKKYASVYVDGVFEARGY